MNIMLVSQCSKRALTETRRILDQFAERRGDCIWQTPITQQGLDTLRKMLKRTARRNTAVACHWIRGQDHTELLWIVGDAGQFNEKGTVPTNITERDILRSKDENDWHTLKDIEILAAISALFHDFGKASVSFQNKLKAALKSDSPIAEAFRHEWVSLRLFEAFVGDSQSDYDWLNKLLTADAALDKACIKVLIRDGYTSGADSPFKNMPPLAQVIGWLIISHHRLPQNKASLDVPGLNNLLKKLGPEWNSAKTDANDQEKQHCWKFEGNKLPFSSRQWCVRASYWAQQALNRKSLFQNNWLKDTYTLHLARLSLMLADHYYSSQPAHAYLGDMDFSLYANTGYDKDGLKVRKQKLDEHLVGVEKNAKRIVNALPLLDRTLPRIARHKRFKQRTDDSRFSWQDKAYDLACAVRNKAATQGFFGVNLASTGCGKTLANARIMYALADPNRGARFSIALGLRTLTLQTGEVYRKHFNLGEDDLGVLVGSSAIKDLFELNLKTEKVSKEVKVAANSGSASTEPLLTDHVHFEGAIGSGPLDHWLGKNDQAKKLLWAPVLVSTVDHLIGATEATRGGKQIAPMLRLMTSDLVLDEPDDFDISDLPALTRLVNWAGMLGSKVLLSSATLPPALIEGLFTAYLEGRKAFQKSRGMMNQAVNISCAWFDENGASSMDCHEPVAFSAVHQDFVLKRIVKLRQKEVCRRAVIKPLNISSKEPAQVRLQVTERLHGMIHDLHRINHSVDPKTQKKVSFGLIRFANIDPLIDVAQNLLAMNAQENHRIYICCYHSRHPLLVRSKIEKTLDTLLDRRNPLAVFDQPDLRKYLDADKEENVIFIVLATAVAEVGRDHSYNWAIVEPSSMRSVIQLAGRVRRHWPEAYAQENIYLLETNIKSMEEQNGTATFCKPGFEKKGFLLKSHNLNEILLKEQYSEVNAEPRIVANKDLKPTENLVDLEHARLQALMMGIPPGLEYPISLWWTTDANLAGELQYNQRFRDDKQGRERFALMYDEDRDEAIFYDIEGDTPTPQEKAFQNVSLTLGKGMTIWQSIDYVQTLRDLAEEFDLGLEACAKRFGWVELPKLQDNRQEWFYSLLLGLRRKN